MRSHQVTEGSYTLRSSTVNSETISASMAKAHGFEQAPSVFILNVQPLSLTTEQWFESKRLDDQTLEGCQAALLLLIQSRPELLNPP